MRSNFDWRGRSMRQLTGASNNGRDGASGVGIHIASGSFSDYDAGGPKVGGGGEAVSITRRHGAPVFQGDSSRDGFKSDDDNVENDDDASHEFSPEDGDNKSDDDPRGLHSFYADPDDPYGGVEDEEIMFPQSTHTWLFTERPGSLPFCFAVTITLLSYGCLVLSLINVFEEYEADNPFNVPYQVKSTVRIAQYLALIIALIMEEELPTGLYLLRMISKKSLQKKFPTVSFGRFAVSAIVRLVMGYLFLFNTFVVVIQAEEVLAIFYDVLALQFLQQLDDISFNLAKIDVFGGRLKRAAISKCFRAEFEKEPFALRKRMNRFLKALYFFNLCTMMAGLGVITAEQGDGKFYPQSISVQFGDQIWNDAIVKLPSGHRIRRNLLFSYFNGVYRYDGTHDGRPVYIEQNKFNMKDFTNVTPAEIKYCKSEKAWVFSHRNIRKSREDLEAESDCPWLLRSSETAEYNLLDVNSGWTIWTGSVQQGQLSTVDNACHGDVDCNYHGTCSDSVCQCAENGEYFGLHCEHKKPCNLITGGEGVGGTWSSLNWPGEAVDVRVYQSPVYIYEEGLPQSLLQQNGVDASADQMYLIYTGSRWLGIHFPLRKLYRAPRSWWENYMLDYHAFWEDTYNTRTKFSSNPTEDSASIIGVDFFLVGKRGEEYGHWGQLFPLGDPDEHPEGSGFFSCIESTDHTYSWDLNFVDQDFDFDDNVGKLVVEYEIKIGQEWETELLDRQCTTPVTNINHNMTFVKSPLYTDDGILVTPTTHEVFTLTHTLAKSQLLGSNIWHPSRTVQLCHAIKLIDFDYAKNTKIVLHEEKILATATNVNPWD